MVVTKKTTNSPQEKVTKVTDPRINAIRGFYTALFNKLFGFAPVINYPKTGAVIKRLLALGFTESQCYLLICVHFNWKGVDGDDEFAHKQLKNRAFPLEWVSFKINEYQAYIRNVLEIDFSDDKTVKDTVAQFIHELK